MKVIQSALMFVMFLLPIQAQVPENDTHASDKQALRALAEKYENAINQGNFSSLKEFVAPSASAVFMTGHELVGLDAMQKYYDEVKVKLGTGSSYSVKLNPADTEFYDSIAVTHGTSDERVTFGNGKQLAYQSKWTAVLQKNNDQWIAIRMHVSIDPIDNPFITMKNQVTHWIYSSVAGLSGALLAWLIARRNRNRG
jgi:ketosteroid isomerase-like protein